ncbi:MAG: hypothetical protein KAX49_04305 [Halanaerobiales bacterium]|nr:hypothetical protein [Halanaerobiales bacterium]
MKQVCENLQTILERLDLLNEKNQNLLYKIPKLWHYQAEQAKEILEVNPYEFFSKFIREYFLTKAKPDIENYLQPLSFCANDENWLENGKIYSVDIRSATSWDHDGDGELVHYDSTINELGTFFKTLCLIPHMKKMGLNILYLLPIYLTNKSHYKTGELGSIYSTNNFYKLNPELHDRILDLPSDPFPIEVEFKALVEACHLAEIRVTLDYPMRTISRDTDLLINHPDWFYWIDLQKLPYFRVLNYNFVGELQKPNIDLLKKIYPAEETKEHIKLYTYSPDQLDPEGWSNLINNYNNNPNQNFLKMVEDKFQVTTSPSFSDQINDPQPCWSDITYYRLYLDEPTVRNDYFGPDTPPFLFYDSIKANKYKGNLPNVELWEYLSDIIPYYQKNYGIDGARIDMAHALPEQMEKMIMKKTFDLNPKFKFISEELCNDYDQIAKDKGYHAIVGTLWGDEYKLTTKSLIQILKRISGLSLPVLACSEIPDTPRAASRPGKIDFSRMTAVLNFFLPTSIPFINCGFEFLERQPMNLGLDASEQDRYVLDKDDPYYGRLSFYDPFQLHWLNEGSEEMINLIAKSAKIHANYQNLIKKPDLLFIRGITDDSIVQFGYRDEKDQLICLINLDPKNDKQIHMTGRLLLSSSQKIDRNKLKPYEVRIYLK